MKALKSCSLFERVSDEYIERAIDCFKLKAVKAGELIVRKEDFCKNLIFFVAEGQYYISDSGKRAKIYGASSLEDSVATYMVDIKMKEAGKIAYTTLDELVGAFGCNLHEAIKHTDSISKMLEIQKNSRNQKHESVKNIKINDFYVLKKLGEGQFGTVFLVTDKAKENYYALKSISKYETIKVKL